jgi:hypothetical protein
MVQTRDGLTKELTDFSQRGCKSYLTDESLIFSQNAASRPEAWITLLYQQSINRQAAMSPPTISGGEGTLRRFLGGDFKGVVAPRTDLKGGGIFSGKDIAR